MVACKVATPETLESKVPLFDEIGLYMSWGTPHMSHMPSSDIYVTLTFSDLERSKVKVKDLNHSKVPENITRHHILHFRPYTQAKSSLF